MISNTSDILRTLNEKPIHRTFAIDRAAVKPESRTVRIAFASDKPVEQWFGNLSLSMKGKSMRTTRLKSGAPLLCDHDPKDIVGVIEDYSIGTDGIARADVRFGESTRAQEVFKDVKNGIRCNVSVGFLVHKMDRIEDGAKGTPPAYRSEDWEPYEVSLVSVPADISVGVGRSKSLEKIKMENENTERSINLTAADEIREWGKILKMEPVADRYLRDNALSPGGQVSVDGFRAFALANRPPNIQIPLEDPAAQAYRQGGIGYYQPAVSVPRHSVRNFTGDNASEKAYRFGQWLLGGPCGVSAARQWCMERGLLSRAMSEGVNEKGGYLVPEEFGNDLIVLLEQHGVFRRNAKVRTMNSDMRSDPLLTAGLTSEFVGESEEGNDQDLTYSRVSLVARKQMILVPFSSELSEDSSLAIGDELAGAAARSFAEKEDLCGFVGDASSTYGGMTGVVTNLKSVSGTIASIAGLQVSAGNAYNELVLTDFEGVAARLPEYADQNAKWFVSKSFYWNVMVPLLLTGGTVAMSTNTTATSIEAKRSQTFLGYPVEFVQVMPKVAANSQVCALLGDLSLGALFGDRRSTRISISDQALYRQDDLLFKATERFDVNSAFGVGNTTDAGPIVGLITAAA